MYDTHVHASLARMVQEGGVKGPADGLVAAEAKGNVGHTCSLEGQCGWLIPASNMFVWRACHKSQENSLDTK